MNLSPHNIPSYCHTNTSPEKRTGYGQHGDYVFGWKGDSLQQAMDNSCFATNCKQLKTQNFNKANQCVVKNAVKENTDGCMLSFLISFALVECVLGLR